MKKANLLIVLTAMIVVSPTIASAASYVAPEDYVPNYTYYNDQRPGDPSSKWDAGEEFAVKRMGVDVSDNYLYFSIGTNYSLNSFKSEWPGDLLISVGDSYYNLYNGVTNPYTGQVGSGTPYEGVVYGLAMTNHSQPADYDGDGKYGVWESDYVKAGTLYKNASFQKANYDDYEIHNMYADTDKDGEADGIRPYPNDPFDDALDGDIDRIVLDVDGKPVYDADGKLQYVDDAMLDNDMEINTLPTVINGYEKAVWGLDEGINIREVINADNPLNDYFSDYQYNIEGWIPLQDIGAYGKTVELWWTMLCGNDAVMASIDVQPVPEPATMILLSLSSLGLFIKRKFFI